MSPDNINRRDVNDEEGAQVRASKEIEFYCEELFYAKLLQFKDDICAFTGFGDDNIQNESNIVKTDMCAQ